MKIESKKHSSQVIKNLNLNRVPELILNQFDKDAIAEFCDKNKSNLYILRDLQNPSGKYYFCKTKKECVDNSKNYKGDFSIAISCFAYNGIVLVGEIYISKENVVLVGRNDKDANHRNLYEKPCVNFNTTLEDNSLWEAQGVEEIIGYVVEHNLYDMVIEFIVYDHEVGVNNEKILIVELRTEY